MDKVFFVTWYIHNKINDGWAYKVEGKYTSKDDADKAYFTALSTYVGGNTYDIVICTLIDSDGITWEKKRWPEIISNDE